MSQILNVQVDEKPDKSELTASLVLNRPTPGPPHDKKPWLSPPMVPTPLLPLPTLSFTVSQVNFTFNYFQCKSDQIRISEKYIQTTSVLSFG